MEDKIFNFLINYFSNINDRRVNQMNNFRGNISSDEVVEWLKKVQNIPVEHPSGDLEKAAKEYVKENCILPEDCNDGDNQYYEECTVAVFKDGANWQKEQLINRACTWILNNFRNSGYGCPLYYNGVNYAPNYIVKDFKKAMED